MVKSVCAALLGIVVALCFVSRVRADESLAAYWLAERARTVRPTLVADGGTVISSGIAAMVSESAARHGVPANVAHAIVRIESGYNCRARSWAGAVGIMQTLPRTARGVGITGPLTDCATGLEAGMRYLAAIIELHGISCASLGLYERGMAARPRCTGYGAKAIRLARL